MQKRFILFVAASAVFMTTLLLIDRDGVPQQLALGVSTAVFLWAFARRSDVEPRQIITAIIVASCGEIVLSLGWGLYSYKHFLIPLYVPPGHGLFYALAADTANQPAIRKWSKPITRFVMIFGSAYAVLALAIAHDAWGFLWWLTALALIVRSRNQLMLSACFIYTIILEWTGTAIGNWQWTADVPFVHLHSANPPAGVGLLYILLDLIVVAVTASQRPHVNLPSDLVLDSD
jgi:hypothetical protein